MPDTTLGVFTKPQRGVAGVDALGRVAEEEVAPARRPDRSRIGRTSSSVVPG